MMTDYPPGTRVRKISVQSGPIPLGATGTVIEAVTANGVPAYVVIFDVMPDRHVLTPAARIEEVSPETNPGPA
jgi:hypothetical protein